jgi:hypothetical protein
MAQKAVREIDGEAAVVAHRLLNSMAVVSAGVVTLWDHWSQLAPDARDDLFERVLAHSDLVTEALRDIAQGLPQSTVAELAAHQRRRMIEQ